MTIEKNGNVYSIIRTNDTTADGEAIFKYAVFNHRGQHIDSGFIEAATLRIAVSKL